ncbi:MAG: hypothetical protein PHS92_02775 [Candidatus Gracilibacteria bacterium]|nr:hypothetical protein [Candidatus Gracilibacteria bacterium]
MKNMLYSNCSNVLPEFRIGDSNLGSVNVKDLIDDVESKYETLVPSEVGSDIMRLDEAVFHKQMMFFMDDIIKVFENKENANVGLNHYLRNGTNIIWLLKSAFDIGAIEITEEQYKTCYTEYLILSELHCFLILNPVDHMGIMDELNSEYSTDLSKKGNIGYILEVVKKHII